MNWRKIRIGDFLHRVRIPVDIEDDQQYNLVTIRMHHKGVALRASKPGREIGTKRMYKVQPGHFILSGIDARHGAFGIVPAELAGAVVTNDFWYFEVDEEQVDKALFLYLTSTSFFDDLCRIASDGTTNRVRLQADKFFNYEINLPPVQEQRELVSRLQLLNAQVALVQEETEHQMLQLTLLRQALLREAMQGQLLPQDPTDEPAAVLLQQLQAARVTTGKKGWGALFEEDAVAVEGPYEIPASWVWCRLGNAGDLKRGKSKHRPRNDSQLFEGGTYPFIQTGDVSKAKYNQDLITTINGYYNEFGLRQSEMQPKGTLCITIAANIAECGFLSFDACAPDSIVCFSSINKYAEKYVYYYLKIAKEELERFAPATAQKNINLGILNELIIPLPPLAEQRRIVAKLEQLLGYCDALEQRIRVSRRLAEQLLATALREALAPSPGTALAAAPAPEAAAPEPAAPRRRGRPARPAAAPLFD